MDQVIKGATKMKNLGGDVFMKEIIVFITMNTLKYDELFIIRENTYYPL